MTIDGDLLRAPVSGDSPAGLDLRYEGTYDRIQQARREDDPNLPQGIWQTSLKRADWEQVHQICREALESKTKDLQIAIWMLEALLSLRGFAGVKEGLGVINDLCDTFWDSLYPTDVEYRIAPVEWMNEKLSIRLKQIPITDPASGDAVPYAWADWESARQLENLAKKNAKLMPEAEREGKVTIARFDFSVRLTPIGFFVATDREIGEAIDATVALESFLDARCGRDAPSLVRFRDTLMNIRLTITDILDQRKEEIPVAQEESISIASTSGFEDAMSIAGFNDVTADNGVEESVAQSGPLTIRNRADAYRLLSIAADYLMKVEPHSPTPYLVKRAIAWGNMPLASLLQELVDGNNSLGDIYKLLGIKEMDGF